MIINNQENREKHLEGLDPSTKVQCWYKGLMKYCDPVQIRNVDWIDPNLMGFVFAGPSYDEVTEEEDAAWQEAETRMDVIGQNGNDGEHYGIDNVNHPEHYQSDQGIECIYAIKAALTPEEFRGYCKGNAMKYLWRERMKGGDESLKKADWYIEEILGTRENSAKRAEELA